MSGQTKSILDTYKNKAKALQSEMSATAGDVAGKRETAVNAAATGRRRRQPEPIRTRPSCMPSGRVHMRLP